MIAFISVYAQTGSKANYQQALDFKEKFGEGLDFYMYPRYINNTDIFWYTMSTSEGPKYYIVNPAKASKKLLFDTKHLIGRMSEIRKDALKDLKNFHMSNLKFNKKITEFTFIDGEYRFTVNILNGKVKGEKYKSPSRSYNSSDYSYSPDSCWIVYAKKHNLYLMGNKEKGMDTTVVQLTTTGNIYNSFERHPGDASGICSPRGLWFKNSKIFLIQKEDYTNVEFMHVIDATAKKRPVLKSYKYSFPGDSVIGKYTLAILDIETKKVTDVPSHKWKNQYVEYAYDNKSGDKLYFYRTKRTWDEKDLCEYNIKTGEVRVVINEVDKPFFDNLIAQTHFINDGKEIILRSERDGYGHFYLYDTKTGKLKRKLTDGQFVTGQVERVDTLKREMYFYAFGREKGVDPYYYMLYKTHLDKGGITLITSNNANHKTFISKSCKYIIDTYSRVDLAPEVIVRNNKGKIIMPLEKIDISSFLEKGWKMPERFKVKANDGITDLYGVMWKPIDFDSTKTYPIISEVYPGPHFEYVPTTFSISDSYATQLAQLGFIVIQVGHRGGSPMRGKAYHRHSYGQMRDYPLSDDKAAITQLAQRYPFINIHKVGIFGHSGGGFMSTAALCKYSDFYTAAVSSAGNHDNTIYNTGWIEMNNGVTEVAGKVKEGEKASLDNVTFKPKHIHTNLELAKNYKGHLLLVHGLMDDNVNPAHSIRMARALIEAGKNFDMILLPESNHGFSGVEEEYFIGKMWRHFAKYLLDDSSADYQAEYNKYYEKTKLMKDLVPQR